MEVDDGQHDEQDESADQLEELRRVLAARQPTETGEAETFSNEPCCVRTLVRGVCVIAKGTGAQHRRQTNKELAKQEQYGPRIYSDFLCMSEGGVSTPMLALKIQQVRQDGCHSVGADRLDAVRSEVLSRLHSANCSSNVHQQKLRRMCHEDIERMRQQRPWKG